MDVPVFDIKDSYIIKNKIDYYTSISGSFSGKTLGIMFTDYDLARKTQNENAERYTGFIISGGTTSYTGLTFTYRDEQYTIKLDGELSCEYISNITNFINNNEYQRHTVTSPSSYSVGDYVDISFYAKTTKTGSTSWYHDGLSGETWFVSGLTTNNTYWNVVDSMQYSGSSDTINATYWQSTGTTLIDGISTGVTTWSVNQTIPILKYTTTVIATGVTYIDVHKKMEDYIYNNLLKISTAYYSVLNLNHSPNSYTGISKYIKMSPYGGYMKCTLTNTGTTLVIDPSVNNEDIYFDYNTLIITLTGSTTTNYTFDTLHLYNKYTLEKFLDQFNASGKSSGDTIYIDYSAVTTSSGYTGDIEMDVYLTNSGDTDYFMEYTYINIGTSLANSYRCLLTKISGTTFTIITPTTLVNTETITSISNIYTVKDISDMLYECYLNIESS